VSYTSISHVDYRWRSHRNVLGWCWWDSQRERHLGVECASRTITVAHTRINSAATLTGRVSDTSYLHQHDSGDDFCRSWPRQCRTGQSEIARPHGGHSRAGGLAAALFPQIDGLHGWASEPQWPRPGTAWIRGSASRLVDTGY
jgi:hypothetical protein